MQHFEEHRSLYSQSTGNKLEAGTVKIHHKIKSKNVTNMLLVYPLRNTNTRKLQINSILDRKCMNIKGDTLKLSCPFTQGLIYQNNYRRFTLTIHESLN